MHKPTVTFQVLEGIDKGRIFRDLPTPLTVGREEGNVLRLNDERVSRFHAKVQLDEDDYILTDLESTNGTKVNGSIVNIRRLRFGDRIAVGRSILMFGSNDEIAERMARLESIPNPIPSSSLPSVHGDDLRTVQAKTQVGVPEGNVDFEVRLDEPIRKTPDAIYIGSKVLPPLPLKMSASQAARLAEIFDFLHHGLVDATENIQANDDGTQVKLDYLEWQRIQAVQMLISRYLRLILRTARTGGRELGVTNDELHRSIPEYLQEMPMKTVEHTTAIDAQQQADEEAVMRHAFDGKPLDPEVARRVQERGRRITAEIRRVHGLIDDETFQSLLDDDEA